MLLKKAIMAQVGLSAVLICSHAYAMEEDFTTPVSKQTRREKSTEVNKENVYATESQRLWGLFVQSCTENDTVDIGSAKVVFDLLAENLTEEQKIKVLHGFLPNGMKKDIDFRIWLFNVEQASDATPTSKYPLFETFATDETPK